MTFVCAPICWKCCNKKGLDLSIMEYVWGPGKTKGSQSWNINFPKYRKYKAQSGFIKNNIPACENKLANV